GGGVRAGTGRPPEAAASTSGRNKHGAAMVYRSTGEHVDEHEVTHILEHVDRNTRNDRRYRVTVGAGPGRLATAGRRTWFRSACGLTAARFYRRAPAAD